MTELQNKLFEMQDTGYKAFHSKLMPTVPKDKVIGIRTPVLRAFAKEFAKNEKAISFLSELPHKYYEEDNLHAFLIEKIKDYNSALICTRRFLPYIDNWASCDMFMPKVFKSNTDKLIPEIKQWLKSNHVYTVRYAIGLLMKLYLGDKFKLEYSELVASVKSNEYYVNMMRAWYFATALATNYNMVLPYITKKKLDIWTHNKTIQKACESYRISAKTKEYLKKYKIV